MPESMETVAAIFALSATIWLSAGLGLAQLFKRQPARSHGILVTAFCGALTTPVLYLGIQQANWGLLPSRQEMALLPERSRDLSLPEDTASMPTRASSSDGHPIEPVTGPPEERNPAGLVVSSGVAADRSQPVQALPDPLVESEPSAPAASPLSWEGLLLWGWFGASALLLVRLSLDFLGGLRLARQSHPLSDASTSREIEILARKLGLTSAPLLALSESVPSPVLWGWSRPARILLPATAEARSPFSAFSAYRGVYLHELAHLARGDHLSAFLGEFICCLLPWHPLAWWAKRNMEARAEEACDDWAVACGCQADAYAEELVNLAPSQAGMLTMAAVSKTSRLKMRVRRLLRGAFPSPRLGRGWIVGVTLIALLFTGFMSILQPRIVQAGVGEREDPSAEQQAPQTPRGVVLGTTTSEIVVMAEGKPVKGARVWIMAGHDEAGDAIVLGPQESDAQGRSRFPFDPFKVEATYALDQQGRLAVGPLQYGPKKVADFHLSLVKPQSIEALVTHHGKPVAGVELKAEYFRFQDAHSSSTVYPKGFPGEITKSDEKGRVRFAYTPQKSSILCSIADARFAWCSCLLHPGSPNNLELVEGGSLRYSLEGAKEALDLKTIHWSLWQGNQKNQAVFWNRFSDSNDQKSLITNIAPGEYTLSLSSDTSFPYLFGAGQTVSIRKGETTSVTVPVKPAALIKGRLVDAQSGKGVPQFLFTLHSTPDNKEKKQDWVQAKTDEQGFYRVHVRGNGHYGVLFSDTVLDSDRYQPPPYDPKTKSNGAHGDVKEGDVVTFPDVAMTPSAAIRGKILVQDHPGAREPVQVFCPMTPSKNPGSMADFRVQDSNLEIKGIPPGVPLTIRIRQGKAVNIPERLTPDQWADAPKFQLSEGNAVSFVGVVLDQQSKPLPRARVNLFWIFPVQGRDSTLSTTKLMEVAETDEQGKFRCSGCWPHERFYLAVECDGYQPTGGDHNATKKGEPGETVDFGTFRLTRTSASVQGKVVGLDGKPIRGLSVRAAGQTEKTKVQTDEKGRFQVDQVSEGPGILLVGGRGFRSHFAPFSAGEKELTIVVRRLTETPEANPVIAEEYLAARKKMIGHMLESLWKTRMENGFGRPILESMNRFDPARSRAWVEQTPHQEKKQWEDTLVFLPANDSSIQITRENVEDVIAVIHRSAGPSARYPPLALYRLGKRYLKENKEIALRLAEEAALKARLIDSNETTWKAVYLADAGELAWRAGNQAGGRKLIEEAIESLKKNPKHRLFEAACEPVAACLATIDWSEAKKVLDLCSDPFYFNSGLSACLKKLVLVDPNGAIEKLKLIKEERSFVRPLLVISLARSLAPQDFQKAMSLVEGLKVESFYAQGLVEIALKIHSADQRTAHQLIEQAFDYLDGNDHLFATWISAGGRPVLAAQIVYFAKKMDYPDLKSLITRSLGYLEGPSSGDSEARKQQSLLAAYVLAFSDPVTAKKLAAMHITMEELARQWSAGGIQKEGHLLVMIDPEKAMAGFDAKAATGWNSQKVSSMKLWELFEIFTKPGDMMENMTFHDGLMWRSLERN